MKLREIKEWIESLPDEFLEFNSFNAELGEIEDTNYTYRLDKEIMTLVVDEETKEILFLNDAPKEN